MAREAINRGTVLLVRNLDKLQPYGPAVVAYADFYIFNHWTVFNNIYTIYFGKKKRFYIAFEVFISALPVRELPVI